MQFFCCDTFSTLVMCTFTRTRFGFANLDHETFIEIQRKCFLIFCSFFSFFSNAHIFFIKFFDTVDCNIASETKLLNNSKNKLSLNLNGQSSLRNSYMMPFVNMIFSLTRGTTLYKCSS